MKICPCIALVGTGEHLDQRGFAGAIVAEKANDFAGIEINAGVIHGLDAAEGNGDVAHLNRAVCRAPWWFTSARGP